MKKHLQLLVLLAALLVPWVTQAQDVQDYTFATGVDSTKWITLSSTATHVTSIEGEDDEASSCMNMGFTFNFGGTNYTQFSCNSNGRIRLGSNAVSNGWSVPFSSISEYPLLCAFTGDMTLDCTDASVRYELTGTAPSRIFVIEYALDGNWNCDIIHFQVQLLEDSSKVRFVYGSADATSGLNSFQVGLIGTATDLLRVNPTTHTIATTTSSYSSFPGQNRYYEFTPYIPTCPKVSNLTVDSLSVDWAALSWNEMGQAQSWIIEYDTVNFTPGNSEGTLITANDTVYTLTGLDTATTYYLYLHADCGAGDTSLNRFITFSTLASLPATMPYSCNFEGDGTNGWDFVNSATNQWCVGSAAHNGTGTKGMYISNTNGTSHNYSTSGTQVSYAYRTFNLAEDGEYAFSYDWQANGESSWDYLRVWLAPASFTFTAGQLPNGSTSVSSYTTTTPAGWISLDGGGKLNLSSSWQTKTVVTQATAGSYNLVFMWCNDGSGGTQPPAAIDNVSAVRNTCPQVQNLQASHVTSDSIILTWNPGGEESEWIILTGEQFLTTNDSTYTFSELTPDSTYQFAVYAVCGADDTSLVQNLTVHTPCVELTSEDMPYRYGFEDATASGTYGDINSCWAKKCNSTASYYPYPSTSAAHSGSYGMYFYAYYRPWLVLPATTVSYDSLTLSFWGKRTSTSYSPMLEIGTVTDINTYSSFTPYDTIVMASNTDWTLYESSLNALPSSGRIAIRLNSAVTYDYTYFYLDDVTLNYTPTCPHPVNFTKDFSNGDTVSLSWNEAGSATAWDVCYGPTGFNTDTVEVNLVNSTDSSLTLTGLPMGVTYDFYVRSVCSSEDVGDWYGPITVLTGFVYTMATSGTDTVRGCGYIITDDGGPDGLYSAGCNSTLILFPSDSTQTLIVSGQSYTEGSWDYVRIYDGVGTSGTQLWNDYGVTAQQTFGPFTSDEGAITIFFYSDGSAQYDGFQIAASCVDLPDCVRPNRVAVSGVDDQSATISWNERGTATAWQLEYGPHGFTPGDSSATSVTATTNPFTLTGLTPSTNYDVYVSSDCSGEMSLTSMVSFRTACTAIDSLPYFYGFEDCTTTATGAAINACWTKGSTYNAGYPYPYSSGATGNRSLYFYNYAYSGGHTWAALPIFNHELDSLQLKFKVKRNSSYTYSYYNFDVQVGVMTDPTNINTFTSIGTYTATSNTTWDSFTVYLASYTGTGRYIAFRDNGNGTSYYTYLLLDDVEVDYAPSCGPVSDINVQTTPFNALISWTPSAVGEYSGAVVGVQDTATQTWIYDTVSGTTATFTGLTPEQFYNVSVVTECTEGESMAATSNFLMGARRCGTMVPGTADTLSLNNGIAQTTGVPVNSIWGNTMCQSIWSAAELHNMGLDSGTVIGIDYTWTNNSSYAKEFTILLGSVANDTVYSSSSFINPATHTMVYSGNHPLNTSGTVHYDFESTYHWNGTDNLVITTFMNQPTGSSHSSSGFYGRSTAATGNRTVYAYQDGTAYTVTNYTSGYHYTSTYRPTVTIYTGVCQALEDCVAPAPTVTGQTPYTISVAWAPGNTETSWNIYYKSAADNNYTYAANTTTNSYTFSGLSSGTNYDFKVVANCGDDSNFAECSGTTECAMIDVFPYTEDFNSWGTGTGHLPNCWNREGSYSSYPYIYSYYNASGNTGGSVYFYLYNNGTNYCRLTMPEVDTTVQPINNLQLYFQLRQSSSSYVNKLEVGVMTNPNDITTFVPVDTVSMSGLTTTQWYDFEVPLNNYSDTGTYITFRSNTTGSYTYLYLDDVTLETIPTCQRPDSLRLDSVTTTTFTAGWHERGNATEWVIEYGPVGFTPGTGTMVSANSNPFTVTNLASSYVGEFYVYSVCSASDTSPASRRAQRFATTQIPATLPYHYNFEDGTEWANWQTHSNCTTNWFRGSADAYDSTYSMYISADNGATVSNGNYSYLVKASAYRDIDFGPVDSSYNFSFKTRIGGNTTNRYDGMMVFLVDPATPVQDQGTTILESPWGNINQIYRITEDRCDTTWHTLSASFDTIHGVHRVAFYYFCQALGGVGGPAEVDDINITYAPCPRPVNLEADLLTLTSSTATIDWTGTASSYQIVYRSTTDTVNTWVNTSMKPYTISNLSMNTTYYCWVRKICGSDTSLFSDGIQFTTTCFDGAVATYPYVEGFEGGVDCWSQEYVSGSTDWASGSGAHYSYGNVTSAYSGSYNAEFFNTSGASTMLVSPLLNLAASSLPVKLTFAHSQEDWGSDQDTLGVYYRVHPDSSWVYLTSYNSSIDYWQFDSVMLPNLTATYQVGFLGYGDYGYGVTLDEVTIYGPESGCPAPAITSETHDYQSATINWTGNGTSYEVEIRPYNVASYSGTPTAVQGTTYTFTGLQPATIYYYHVRQDCNADSNGYSAWTTEGTFTTDSMPCFAPTDLHVTAATNATATLAWTAGTTETAWEIHVFNTTFDQTFEVTTNPATVNGLTAGVEYNAAIRALCGDAHNIYGEYGDTIQFTTDICDPVSSVHATANGVDITVTWTAGENNTGNFEIEYGEAGYGQGEQIGSVNVNGTSYTFTGLEPETDYGFHVRAICAEDWTSVWSSQATATTGEGGGGGEGIYDVNGSFSCTIFPNPATDATTISVSGVNGEVTITVVDMNGRTLSSETVNCAADCVKKVNVSNLSQGAYFVRIYGENVNSVKKLIVK